MFSLHPLLQRYASPIILLVILAYLFVNYLYGNHGFFAYKEKQKILTQEQKTLAQTKVQEAKWQQLVDSLKEKSLDPDVLDERARLMLNMSGQDDIILLRNNKEPLF